MDKRYKKKGLTIIGEEVQGSTVEAIEEVAKEARLEFPITKGSDRPAGMQGIPHAVVFDAAGKMVFTGSPMDDDFDRTIKKALRDVEPDGDSDDSSSLPASSIKPVIESRTWTNEDGKKITASVLSIDGDKVKFQLANGRSVDYPINQLSEADRKLLSDAAEKKAGE